MDQIALLSERLENFKQMKSLAENQIRALTDNQGLDRFLDVMRQREQLRSRIMAHDRKLKRMRQKERLLAHAKTIQSLEEETAAMIAATLQLDRRIEEQIGRLREELLADIRDLRRGRKAVKGYGAKSNRTANRINRLG